MTTNVVSTVEPSGGDQAQVKICPADAEAAPAVPTPTPAVEVLPDAAIPVPGQPGAIALAIVAFAGFVGLVLLGFTIGHPARHR